jgi:outer membrane receptor for ferrienterochelin and colicin
VKNGVSSDAFGSVADLNLDSVADLNLDNFLMRLPGISKEDAEGEIIRVQIRGVDSNINAVTIDGTGGASGSTRDFNRAFEVENIPADSIETIAVTKAATPEMDADSTGGGVNLKTKSALDRKGRRTTYQLGNSLKLAQKSFRPMGSFSYADVLVVKKQGCSLRPVITRRPSRAIVPTSALIRRW